MTEVEVLVHNVDEMVMTPVATVNRHKMMVKKPAVSRPTTMVKIPEAMVGISTTTLIRPEGAVVRLSTTVV